jgi:cyanophycin synthetase
MEDFKCEWLPNLTSEMLSGARKTKLCAYSVALEGWRRGLTLKWYTKDSEHYKDMVIFGVNPPGRLFSLSSNKQTHYFFRTRGDKVSSEAVRIGSDKEETKKYLRNAGVPTPAGGRFTEEHNDEDVFEAALKMGFPLVIKPTNGSLGNGVITNILDETRLKRSIDYVRNELNYKDVIVERYYPGDEYRIYVVEDKVIAAYNRVPANVVGDGIHTIEELIEIKNTERKRNPRLFSCLIEMDEEIRNTIEKAGYTLESIPAKGEHLFISQKSNISAGGDPIDVTDELPQEIRKIAINAVKAIPGLHHGGVDIIIDKDKPISEGAVVIEINPTAQIGGILFPIKGKARNIPAAIIDYYFPETKGTNTEKSTVYFDLNTVLEPLVNRSAIEVQVMDAPIGKIYAKKYTVYGTVQKVSYHRWLRKVAYERNLHGYVKNLPNGAIEVLVAGTDREAVNEYRQLFSKDSRAKVTRITEEIYREPIKVGFEINEGMSFSNLKTVEKELKKVDKELHRSEKEIRKLEKETKKIQESNTWRVTSPLRKIGRKLKNT